MPMYIALRNKTSSLKENRKKFMESIFARNIARFIYNSGHPTL